MIGDRSTTGEVVVTSSGLRQQVVRAVHRASVRTQLAKLELKQHLAFELLVTAAHLSSFNASPVQRALVRAADAAPVGGLLTPGQMLLHFGCERLPVGRPRFVVVRAGVRSGKSLIAALSLLHSILTCRLRRPAEPNEVPGADGLVGVRPGERVRAVIVAPALELARTVYAHLVGTMLASPDLRPLLPAQPGVESTYIRRPVDGMNVEVRCLAAAAAGVNLRSTWLAGVVFDEADFFDAEGAAVNLDEQIDAAAPRLLAGGQAWVVSSPWAAEGPYYEFFKRAFGHGDADTLGFHSDSRSMNPTLDRALEAAERVRDPDKAAREYDAIPLDANASQFFPEPLIARAVDEHRPLHLPPVAGYAHEAGTDLGFRKNSSALAIARARDGRVELVYHEELRPTGGQALVPSAVCRAFGAMCVGYGVTNVCGDLHYAETAREYFRELGVAYDDWVPTSESNTAAFTALRVLMAEHQLSLPNDPRLLKQLRDTRYYPAPGGTMRICLPKHGRAHGDVLVAVVLACTRAAAALVVNAAPCGVIKTSDFETQGIGW